MKGSRLLTGLLAVLLLQGCSALQQRDVAAPVFITETPLHPGLEVAAEEGWWRVAFQIDRPGTDATRWHLDLLLAHRVIAPAIMAHEHQMVAWRFHRRAADDATGHRFSFIFYAHRSVADEIYRVVQADPLLTMLKLDGSVKQDSYTDTAVIPRPMIDDTSDRNWSEAMQAVWPIYINGVSQMWLTLIDIYARRLAGDSDDFSLAALEDLYMRVDAEVTARWREEGQHALLHHLNAMFGYEPLLIRELTEKRF